MNVTLISDFDFVGSGYLHLASNLGVAMTKMGHKVLALGVGYIGNEHHYPFGIVQVPRGDYYKIITAMVSNLKAAKNYTDVVMCVMDIPHQVRMLYILEQFKVSYVGVFAMESLPLNREWTLGLSLMNKRYVISEFALAECKRVGLSATHLKIPVDLESWRQPTPDERVMMRNAMAFKPETKVVLTVAENQERKNLSAALEIIKQAIEQDPNITYMLVTDKKSGVGWKLDPLISEMGLQSKVLVFQKGMPFSKLWGLYAMADAFMLTSRAEGLAIPILEAMSMRIPCIAPNHTAFTEHLSDGRGYLFDVAFIHRDPFGNEYRYFADVKSGSDTLLTALNDPIMGTTEKAYSYVSQRSWDQVAQDLQLS